jgi:hypothetical protein
MVPLIDGWKMTIFLRKTMRTLVTLFLNRTALEGMLMKLALQPT